MKYLTHATVSFLSIWKHAICRVIGILYGVLWDYWVAIENIDCNHVTNVAGVLLEMQTILVENKIDTHWKLYRYDINVYDIKTWKVFM